MKKLLTTLAGFSLLAPVFGLINFEMGSATTSGSFSPSDNLNVASTIFESGAADIQFSFSSGVPTIEDANNGESRSSGSSEGTGDPLGFITSLDGDAVNDTTDSERVGFSGLGLDDYFLRGDSLADFGIFTIDYVNGTSSTELGFQIWDIDGSATDATEEYTINFFDDINTTGTTPIGSIVSPEESDDSTSSFDGAPFAINFAAPGGNVITRVEIDFTGSKSSSIGLAFDNFDPEGTIVPEPAGLGGLFGIAALLVARRRVT